MASILKLNTQSNMTSATLIEVLDVPGGAFEKATFWVQTVAASTAGTWTVAVSWINQEGGNDTLASVAAVNGATQTLTVITADADFDGAPPKCVPMPNRLVLARTAGTGPFKGHIYGAFA